MHDYDLAGNQGANEQLLTRIFSPSKRKYQLDAG